MQVKFLSNLNLQDASCFLMEEMTFFHDYSMLILTFILCSVLFILFKMIRSKSLNRFLLFNEKIEFIWIVFPGLILVSIALPSLKVLYFTDSIYSPEMTMKVLGHQWYWSYEYPEFDYLEFDSYMISESMMKKDDFRLLEVDNSAVLPMKTSIRVMATSSDVIHSWTVPVLGVKMDCIPGRLNQFFLESERSGVFFGQCSEICGVLHSFMPICLEVVEMDRFFNWVDEF